MIPEHLRITQPIDSLKAYFTVLSQLFSRNAHPDMVKMPGAWNQIYIGDVYKQLIEAQSRFIYTLEGNGVPQLLDAADKVFRAGYVTYKYEPRSRLMTLEHERKTLTLFIPPQ